MSSIDVEKLLAPCSDDEPCGENLEYDSEYGEMERACEGKPEQQFGDTIVPAEPPDWKEVKRKGLSLFKRTKDMRVTAHLARAVLACDGLPEFADVVKVMRGLVDQYWESVHPLLDPDDDNDPTFRVNTLATLCDPDSTLALLRKAPLVRSKQLGIFSLHDIEHAREKGGEDESEEDSGGKPSGPSRTTIDAAFTDADPESLVELSATIGTLVEDIEAIESGVTEQVGSSNAVSLDDTVRLLNEMRHALTEQMERRGISSGDEKEDAADESDDEEGGEAVASGSAGGSAAGKRLTGEVLNREDAIRALDKVCEYFEKHEPSSPLPMLIRRAQRLARKSFLDIIRDLAPDGIAQAEAIGGYGGGESAESGGGGDGGGEEKGSSDW